MAATNTGWMRASPFEYRLRYWDHALVFMLGFVAPWNVLVHADATGPNAHTWGVISAAMAKAGVLTIGTAFDLLLALGIVCALGAALLRTWGTAYLGADVVQDGTMHTAAQQQGAGVIASGPYRFLRNPLYVGTFLHALALSLLMPVSGAIFTIVLIAVMQVRLALAEEWFLAAKLGAAYEAYRAAVPRLLPALRSPVASSGASPRWGQAALAELYFWGVAFCFAALGWYYNASLLTQGVVVSFGASLVARAVVPVRRAVPTT